MASEKVGGEGGKRARETLGFLSSTTARSKS